MLTNDHYRNNDMQAISGHKPSPTPLSHWASSKEIAVIANPRLRAISFPNTSH